MRRLKPFLRQYAEQALPLVKSIRDHHQALHAARDADDREAELSSLGATGEAYRLLGQIDKALPNLEAALALARELKRPKQVVTNLIRYATALQYANDHAAALPLFEEAIALAPTVGFGEDFARQHFGKCLAELGRWDEAIAQLTQALALREPKGDAALIDSTREALEAAHAATA